MVDYRVVDWTSSVASLATVAAEIETLLETLDSTTNPILAYDVKALSADTRYQASISYHGSD